MHATIWSLVPFLVVIPLAMYTRQVIPGLVIGLMVGAYLLSHSPLGTIDVALTYLYKEVAVTGNLHLIVFLYLFGSFVGLLNASGGVEGLAKWLEPRIKTVRGAYAITWLSTLVTFMAPDFRIITVAPIMRSVMNRFQVSPDKMAFAIDVTSTPLIALMPVGTAFVGYMVGLLAVSLRHMGSNQSAYSFFLQSIPLNLFSLFILGIGAYLSFFRWSGATLRRGATVDGRVISRSSQWTMEAGMLADHEVDTDERVSNRIKPDVLHLFLPLALLIFLTVLLTWYSGHVYSNSLWGAFIKADAASAMIEAIVITLLLSTIFYLVRNISISQIMNAFVTGGNEMMPVILLLVLVWAVSGVSMDLGFSSFVSHSLGAFLPRLLVAPVMFLLGSILSYVIGSSFGTWGLLMPLGFSLAMSAHASLLLTVAAVFASGTLGGFASPLSDNTVAMATVMKMPAIPFARSLLKPTLLAGAFATVGYAVLGAIL